MDKYCSAKFKTGEELDNALLAALDACNQAASATECRNKAEEHRLAAESAEEQAQEWLKSTIDHKLIAETAAYNAKGYAEGGVVTSYPDAEEYWYSDVPGAKWFMEQAQAAAEATQNTTVDVTEIDGGHRVTITAANGEKTFDVMDGEQGPEGPAGQSIKGDRGEQGPRGYTGEDGQDGVGIVGISYTDTDASGAEVKVFIDLSDGRQKSFSVYNGAAGKDGERGFSVLRVTTAPSSYTTAVGGFTPSYRIALSTVLSESGADEVRVGDTVLRNYYTYHVGYVDSSYVYLGKYASIRGTAGAAGAAGASVTVESVSESTADGGSNVVTFSDGTTLTVKNGNTGVPGERGSDGRDPVRGTDYWTDADKAEIQAYVAAELAKRGQLTPEYADNIEGCTDTSKVYVLPDGFLYAYMGETTEGEVVPNFKNVLDTATIHLNQRFNSSDQLKEAVGYIAIDHLPVKSGDVIRINNVNVISASAGSNRVKYYNSGKSGISTYNGADARGDQLLKLTKANGVMSWVVGYYNTSLGNDSTNTLPAAASNIAYVRMNLFISSASITEADIEDLILTVNQEISYTTTEGGTAYSWKNTGLAFIPADYEDRIIDLEAARVELEDEVATLKSRPTGTLSGMSVFAPSPQLPADGSETADFNADKTVITAGQIYDYLDALAAKYPKFLTKEVLGKDASGSYDWCRYVCSRRAYDAWQKVNYPAMYAWVNGSTVIYSVSVSPRIGDTLYSTTYVGTAKGAVTAVSNANQTRTVGGVVYTRDKTKDVEPTLFFTETAYNPNFKHGEAANKTGVYNSSKSKTSTIATISATAMKDAAGNSYVRYPLGDRDSTFTAIPAIVIGANEHGTGGDPAVPAIVTARMIKDLCECRNADNAFLNLLKNNYMVVFCPIINPWGFSEEHQSYYNSNGVNLDRNFDTPGWGNDTSNPQGAYGGSEAETQYFMNTLVASKTKIALANHALGEQVNATSGEATNAGYCHWMLGRNNSKYTSALAEIAEVMNANYNLVFTDYGQAPPETYAKTRSYIDWIGAEGGAVEMQAREGFVLAGEGNLFTARIMEADYTLLLQFLYMLIDKQ